MKLSFCFFPPCQKWNLAVMKILLHSYAEQMPMWCKDIIFLGDEIKFNFQCIRRRNERNTLNFSDTKLHNFFRD